MHIYKLSSYNLLHKVFKKVVKYPPPPQKKKKKKNYHKRLAYESNSNTICLLYDIRKNVKVIEV